MTKRTNTHLYTLKWVTDYDEHPREEVVFTTDAEDLDSVLQTLKSFLRASGFVFNGELTIAEDV